MHIIKEAIEKSIQYDKKHRLKRDSEGEQVAHRWSDSHSKKLIMLETYLSLPVYVIKFETHRAGSVELLRAHREISSIPTKFINGSIGNKEKLKLNYVSPRVVFLSPYRSHYSTSIIQNMSNIVTSSMLSHYERRGFYFLLVAIRNGSKFIMTHIKVDQWQRWMASLNLNKNSAKKLDRV